MQLQNTSTHKKNTLGFIPGSFLKSCRMSKAQHSPDGRVELKIWIALVYDGRVRDFVEVGLLCRGPDSLLPLCGEKRVEVHSVDEHLILGRFISSGKAPLSQFKYTVWTCCWFSGVYRCPLPRTRSPRQLYAAVALGVRGASSIVGLYGLQHQTERTV